MNQTTEGHHDGLNLTEPPSDADHKPPGNPELESALSFQPSSSASKVKYSVLVVDDNISSQKLLGLSLSMQPQIGEIDYAEHGKMALLKAQNKIFDIVFLDAKMPGMDGYEVCTQLRQLPDYEHTPIIMVTGLTSPMDEAKGIIAGSTSYVTKPVQQLAFKELITRELAILDYKRSLAKAK
jgi:two-component system, cell cycle response regulator